MTKVRAYNIFVTKDVWQALLAFRREYQAPLHLTVESALRFTLGLNVEGGKKLQHLSTLAQMIEWRERNAGKGNMQILRAANSVGGNSGWIPTKRRGREDRT